MPLPRAPVARSAGGGGKKGAFLLGRHPKRGRARPLELACRQRGKENSLDDGSGGFPADLLSSQLRLSKPGAPALPSVIKKAGGGGGGVAAKLREEEKRKACGLFVRRALLSGLIPMGNCFVARIKAESPFHSSPASASNSKPVCKDANDLSSSGSRASAASGLPPTPRGDGEILQCPSLKSFTFSELRTATRNFRPDSVLGEGGFGCVFKGWIDEHALTAAKPGTGMVIAVKKLNQEGLQGHKEWLAEVNFLGRLYHPNLVRLIGYCLEDEHRLLVYEFMPRGSLENHLFRRGSYFQPLSWNLRMKVALGAAKGLAFLHSAEIKVIYRDFKTSNILLDSNYNAKLSDFGLAKDGPTGNKSHVSTRVMGTYGYAAPEYLATGHLTAKSDVYSFGVVLLEMLSGRRAVDKNRPSGEHNLVEWARPYITNKRKIFRVLDTRLEGQYALVGAQKATALALQCLSTESRFRPSMNEVVSALEDLQDAKDAVRTSHAEQNGSSHTSSSSSGHRSRRSSHEVADGKAAYPRPSASPLYTAQAFQEKEDGRGS